jgi:FAD dependent oxidoreductase
MRLFFRDARDYDVIVFGDEVPGVFAAISAAREYRRKTQQAPRVLLLSKGNLQTGIGGHLVRGGLAYLDRSQIKKPIRDSLRLDTFGDPAAIYKEFLQKTNVKIVGLDPNKASTVMRQMLDEAGVFYQSNIELESVVKGGNNIINLMTRQGRFTGRQFIDATVNAELAQVAGAKKLSGFASLGLPDSELAVTVVIETQGISVQRLKEIELVYLKRFTNLKDTEAQKFLLAATGNEQQLAQEIRQDMVDSAGKLKPMWAGADYIDVRTFALSVAYHSFRGTKLSLPASGAILDKANIAILPNNRLSWNALLFRVTASEAEALAKNGGKPTPRMLEEINYIQTWFKSIGATVTAASELYIRHAGNTGVVDTLTGAKMLMGGVPDSEALGTFAYQFDVRGGIKGLKDIANAKGIDSINFSTPVFNIGIQHSLIKDIPNLAVVSPASGFDGLAASAGRIVEFNAGVAQGLGIAAITAMLSNRNLANVSNREVKKILEQTNRLPRIFGISNLVEASRLEGLETSAIA